MFGAVNKRKKLQKLGLQSLDNANATQNEIDILKSENPFESAAAKSAMAKASRTSRQMQTRLLNTMGTQASPEALVAAQGSLNEGIGGAAGEIAAGAESNKNQQLNALRGLKEGQFGQYQNQYAAGEMQRGTGALQTIDSIGKLASAASSFIKPI